MDNKDVSSAILKFSVRFLNELDKTENVISSPLSAEFVLAVLALGASGPSHDEILTQLGISNDDIILKSFSMLIKQLRSIKGVTLNVANKLYVRKGMELHENIEQDAVKVFDTSIEQIDCSNPSGTAKIINDWVEIQTKNRIKDIITEKQITRDLEMILINAIYFKGTWRTPFKPTSTEMAPFYLDANTTVEVPMMNYIGNATFRNGRLQELGAKVLELPYEGGEAKMLIVLPTSVDGLSEVLEKLASGYDLLAELEKSYVTRLFISIPKFKIETQIDLNDVLKKLGIKSIFTTGLDKMRKNGGHIRVTDAIQKAYIDVNEQGTEAAAATRMRVECSMPQHFNANHPFLYTLIGPGRTPLFAGLYRGSHSIPTSD